jgi:hypothetical protein
MAAKNKKIYPEISIKLIKNPSRFYAIPLLGYVIKFIIVVPVLIYLLILNIINFFVWIINSFYILFTGTYWKFAYDFNLGLIRLGAKISFFFYGMTDTYPGFSFEIDDAFSIAIPYPKTPSRFLAIPILGFLIRLILLIPYLIYQTIITRAALIALIVGSFFVTFTGKYPESDFEINRDAYRLNVASSMWFSGLSDNYPSFWISMNHKAIKIVLIVLAALMTVISYGNNFMNNKSSDTMYQQQYNNSSSNIQYNYYNQK